MALEANIVIAYDSTHASIPAGYSRYLALDGRYPLGAASGAAGGTTGGAASHTHTETGHTHTQNSHTHTRSAGASAGNAGGTTTGVPLRNLPSDGHTHGSSNSAAATATNQSTTVTFNTTSNDPPYYEVIWILSDGSADVPNNGMGWFNGTSAPTNFTQVNTDKFWKGAAALGNAGGTGGSSDAHTHTQTGTHNHTQDTHTHTASNSSAGSGTSLADNTASTNDLQSTHTHLITLDTVVATNQAASVTLQNGDGQPPFLKLMGIKNGSGSSQAATDGFVALWFNSLGTIPTGWYLCDGTNTTRNLLDKFCKNQNASSELGTTGGADQHTHIADAHTHTQDTHTHTLTSAGYGSPLNRDNTFDAGTATTASNAHTHTWTIGSTVAVNQNTTITINNNTSKNNYPLYLTAAFIQKGLLSSIRLLAATGAGT